MKNVPILDLSPEIKLLEEDLERAFQQVLDHGRFINGPEVEELESAVAEYIGTKYAIGVNSGTDALLIALRAAGIGRGDEVITTSFTFFATAESIEMAGAYPVFVDVLDDDYNLNVNLLEASVTEKTKAIIPVHLYGKPVNMDRLLEIAKKYDLKVIEDCAQSFGTMYRKEKCGSIGHAGAFSFFPSKNLGGFGDGGMITTDDDAIAEMCRKLRAHGSVKKYHNEMMGYNSRLDTLQAALLNVKLPHIDRFNLSRRNVAHRYIKAFEGLNEIITPHLPDDGHVYHQFTIRVLNDNRDELAEYLKSDGISTMVYYPVPCHMLPVFEGRYDHLNLPMTNKLKDEVLSLPIGPFLTSEDQEWVIESVQSFYSE